MSIFIDRKNSTVASYDGDNEFDHEGVHYDLNKLIDDKKYLLGWNIVVFFKSEARYVEFFDKRGEYDGIGWEIDGFSTEGKNYKIKFVNCEYNNELKKTAEEMEESKNKILSQIKNDRARYYAMMRYHYTVKEVK